MLATSQISWAREIWARALEARQAQCAGALTGADRLAESGLRLNRSHARLDESQRRVDRGRRRRVPASMT
jgi:hypothetical protein